MYNKIVMFGNLTRDPELRESSKGTKVCSFTMATSRKSGEYEETAFVDCVAFGKVGEALGKAGKGERLLVQGRMKTDSWEQEGKKRYKLSCICEEFRFGGSGKKPDDAKAAAAAIEAATSNDSPF
jgi:single-strand DNA-binding protein|tara:strand:- start:3755 stop:4129 length:375 start_codon:yes stop_codon:yes gene_type:complete